MDKEALNLKIQTREDILYKGEVDSLSSVNNTGKFDVLRQHANFISMIKDYLIIREINGKEREVKLGTGIMRVAGNKVNVYLGIKKS